MPKPNVYLESHRFNNKWIIYMYMCKEKTGIFNGKPYKTSHFMDMLKWDSVTNYIRTNYLRENVMRIKAFSLKNGKEDEDETKECIDNLLLSIKLKPVTSDLLGLMDIKAEEAFGCYLHISIEEMAFNAGKLLRTKSRTSDTPDNSERTPMKSRPGTPLPKLRNLPSRNIVEEADIEYKPTNEKQRERSKVPEYVPSVTGMDVAMTEEEYQPEPLNGNSRENLMLQYTPSSKRRSKRRKEETSSPISIPSTKKKRQDSQESLVETLDGVSISAKASVLRRSPQDLFGSDSDNERKATRKHETSLDKLQKKYGVEEKAEPEPETTVDALKKKYDDMEPVPEKKKTHTGSSKAGTSRFKPLKTKGSKSKKDDEPNTVQTSIDKWTNKDSIIAEKTERNKNRKTVERDSAVTNKIAELQKKRERIDAEREKIEQTNDFLEEQIQQQKRENMEYTEKYVFPILTHEELEEKFVMYRTDLSNLFKSAKKSQKPAKSSIQTSIHGFVLSDCLDQMSDILHNNFTQKDKYEPNNFSIDEIISDFLIPEWVFMLFRDEYNLGDEEARDRIKWQTNQLQIGDSFVM